MMTGWVAVKSSAEAGDPTGISKFVYLGGDDEGIMAKNKWLELTIIQVTLMTRTRSPQTTAMKPQTKVSQTGTTLKVMVPLLT